MRDGRYVYVAPRCHHALGPLADSLQTAEAPMAECAGQTAALAAAFFCCLNSRTLASDAASVTSATER